jgi:hypothetical protein
MENRMDGIEKTNRVASDSDERCRVEEVALVVPETDDPSLPVMTFRAWFLGLTSCVLLIFLNTFFTYRTQPLGHWPWRFRSRDVHGFEFLDGCVGLAWLG